MATSEVKIEKAPMRNPLSAPSPAAATIAATRKSPLTPAAIAGPKKNTHQINRQRPLMVRTGSAMGISSHIDAYLDSYMINVAQEKNGGAKKKGTRTFCA